MHKLLFLLALLLITQTNLQAQKKKVDSVRLVISLVVKDKLIETSKNFWPAYYSLPVKLKMFGFVGTKTKHLYKTFDMQYNADEDHWAVTVPRGFFQLDISSLGFKDIQFPLRLKADLEEEFTLEVDSVLYTYKDRKRYDYIGGTLNFNETIIVAFKSGDYATNRSFLDAALAIEGLEHINVRRAYKIKGRNAFVVTLDIWDKTVLETILYRKMAGVPAPERGYEIGPDITKAIELYQANPNVLFANPSFLDDKEQAFRKSSEYAKSEQLEYKLQNYMVEDEATLRKINYIIEKTTPKEEEEEQ